MIKSYLKGKDMKEYSSQDYFDLDDHYQRLCNQQREFVIWEGPVEGRWTDAFLSLQEMSKDSINKPVLKYYDNLHFILKVSQPSRAYFKLANASFITNLEILTDKNDDCRMPWKDPRILLARNRITGAAAEVLNPL